MFGNFNPIGASSSAENSLNNTHHDNIQLAAINNDNYQDSYLNLAKALSSQQYNSNIIQNDLLYRLQNDYFTLQKLIKEWNLYYPSPDLTAHTFLMEFETKMNCAQIPLEYFYLLLPAMFKFPVSKWYQQLSYKFIDWNTFRDLFIVWDPIIGIPIVPIRRQRATENCLGYVLRMREKLNNYPEIKIQDKIRTIKWHMLPEYQSRLGVVAAKSYEEFDQQIYKVRYQNALGEEQTCKRFKDFKMKHNTEMPTIIQMRHQNEDEDCMYFVASMIGELERYPEITIQNKIKIIRSHMKPEYQSLLGETVVNRYDQFFEQIHEIKLQFTYNKYLAELETVDENDSTNQLTIMLDDLCKDFDTMLFIMGEKMLKSHNAVGVMICYYCKGEGHYYRDCPKRKDKSFRSAKSFQKMNNTYG